MPVKYLGKPRRNDSYGEPGDGPWEDPAAQWEIRPCAAHAHSGRCRELGRLKRALNGTSCALPDAEGDVMIKIENVLVATDFGPASDTAVSYGREFARTFGARLHVLHVVENATIYAGPEAIGVDFARVQADLEAGAQQALNRLVTAEDRRQLRALTVIRSGSSPTIEIVDYARFGGRSDHPRHPRTRHDGASADGQRIGEGRPAGALSRVDGQAS
jgi:hypothetical protein